MAWFSKQYLKSGVVALLFVLVLVFLLAFLETNQSSHRMHRTKKINQSINQPINHLSSDAQNQKKNSVSDKARVEFLIGGFRTASKKIEHPSCFTLV
jgi:hypothetical protein